MIYFCTPDKVTHIKNSALGKKTGVFDYLLQDTTFAYPNNLKLNT